MLASIIGLILTCIILGVLLYAAQLLIGKMPIAEPFATIVHVLFILLALIVVVWFLVTLLGFAGIHVPVLSSFR